MANSTATVTATNKLFYGDNLHVLRAHVADESVDLIYLDPPFNSKRDYNLLFKTPEGFDGLPTSFGAAESGLGKGYSGRH